jgi:hypothetical protein
MALALLINVNLYQQLIHIYYYVKINYIEYISYKRDLILLLSITP